MTNALTARAVVVREPGAPAAIEEIVVDPPGPGEVLVRVIATGVCHTDLNAKLGHFAPDFPYLLGHEACGVVEAHGPGVTSPPIGATVVLSWRAPCGACRACRVGKPDKCTNPATAQKRMKTADGKLCGRVLGLGTFTSHTVVHATQAIQIPSGIPPEVACLIGCGVLTGVGAALYAAPVEPGSSVAVFGCGAVGLSVIQGAKLRRAARIFAVDLSPKKLEAARRFGATDAILAGDGDPGKAVRKASGGGVQFAFDCVGIPDTVNQALGACEEGGTTVLIGMPIPGATAPISLTRFFYARATLRATFFGDGLATRDFPLLCGLYQRGELELDAMVSQKIRLEDIEAAFTAMKQGDVLRSVIVI